MTGLQHPAFWGTFSFKGLDTKTIIKRSRYPAIISIISLLHASFAAFAWDAVKTVSTTLLVIQSPRQRLPHHQ